jgi:type IV secretory pathway VirB10-like protein
MSDRDPDLARMLELYQRAKAPTPEARERVWHAVEAAASVAPEVGSTSAKTRTLELAVLAGVLIGAGGLWLASGASWSPANSEPVAERPTPAASATVERPPMPAPAADTSPSPAPPAPPTPRLEPTLPTTALPPSDADGPQPRGASRTDAERIHPSSLAQELALLTAARQAVRSGKIRKALSVLGRHARRFPDGVMAEEREAERVAALCALGRTDQATRAAQAFLARFTGSPQSARVSRACETSETEASP